MNEDAVGGEQARGLSELERVVDTFVAPTATFKDILRSTAWTLAGEGGGEVGPGRDAELAVGVAEVVLDGRGGDETIRVRGLASHARR